MVHKFSSINHIIPANITKQKSKNSVSNHMFLKGQLNPLELAASLIKCPVTDIAQKMKFSIKDFISKCERIHRKLRIWSRLLKKSLIENFIFCAVAEQKLNRRAEEIL